MIVVADTSPLNYLILIDQIPLLEHLYGSISIPSAVQSEMLRAEAPLPVRIWAAHPPAWVAVHPMQTDPLRLTALDMGEREAIALALHLKAPALIMDEALGRREAQALGLRVIGTLGILRAAATTGLLDLQQAIRRLQTTHFHISPAILAKVLQPDPVE